MIPHGRHIYAKASDMENAKTFAYPHSDHVLPHWKCVLRYCSGCPHININDQEKNKKYEKTTPSIRFHIYHIIGRCTAHGRIPLKDKKICYMCKQESSPDEFKNIHTPKNN